MYNSNYNGFGSNGGDNMHFVRDVSMPAWTILPEPNDTSDDDDDASTAMVGDDELITNSTNSLRPTPSASVSRAPSINSNVMSRQGSNTGVYKFPDAGRNNIVDGASSSNQGTAAAGHRYRPQLHLFEDELSRPNFTSVSPASSSQSGKLKECAAVGGSTHDKGKGKVRSSLFLPSNSPERDDDDIEITEPPPTINRAASFSSSNASLLQPPSSLAPAQTSHNPFSTLSPVAKTSSEQLYNIFLHQEGQRKKFQTLNAKNSSASLPTTPPKAPSIQKSNSNSGLFPGSCSASPTKRLEKDKSKGKVVSTRWKYDLNFDTGRPVANRGKDAPVDRSRGSSPETFEQLSQSIRRERESDVGSSSSQSQTQVTTQVTATKMHSRFINFNKLKVKSTGKSSSGSVSNSDIASKGVGVPSREDEVGGSGWSVRSSDMRPPLPPATQPTPGSTSSSSSRQRTFSSSASIPIASSSAAGPSNSTKSSQSKSSTSMLPPPLPSSTQPVSKSRPRASSDHFKEAFSMTPRKSVSSRSSISSTSIAGFSNSNWNSNKSIRRVTGADNLPSFFSRKEKDKSSSVKDRRQTIHAMPSTQPNPSSSASGSRPRPNPRNLSFSSTQPRKGSSLNSVNKVIGYFDFTLSDESDSDTRGDDDVGACRSRPRSQSQIGQKDPVVIDLLGDEESENSGGMGANDNRKEKRGGKSKGRPELPIVRTEGFIMSSLLSTQKQSQRPKTRPRQTLPANYKLPEDIIEIFDDDENDGGSTSVQQAINPDVDGVGTGLRDVGAEEQQFVETEMQVQDAQSDVDMVDDFLYVESDMNQFGDSSIHPEVTVEDENGFVEAEEDVSENYTAARVSDSSHDVNKTAVGLNSLTNPAETRVNNVPPQIMDASGGVQSASNGSPRLTHQRGNSSLSFVPAVTQSPSRLEVSKHLEHQLPQISELMLPSNYDKQESAIARATTELSDMSLETVSASATDTAATSSSIPLTTSQYSGEESANIRIAARQHQSLSPIRSVFGAHSLVPRISEATLSENQSFQNAFSPSGFSDMSLDTVPASKMSASTPHSSASDEIGNSSRSLNKSSSGTSDTTLLANAHNPENTADHVGTLQPESLLATGSETPSRTELEYKASSSTPDASQVLILAPIADAVAMSSTSGCALQQSSHNWENTIIGNVQSTNDNVTDDQMDIDEDINNVTLQNTTSPSQALKSPTPLQTPISRSAARALSDESEQGSLVYPSSSLSSPASRSASNSRVSPITGSPTVGFLTHKAVDTLNTKEESPLRRQQPPDDHSAMQLSHPEITASSSSSANNRPPLPESPSLKSLFTRDSKTLVNLMSNELSKDVVEARLILRSETEKFSDKGKGKEKVPADIIDLTNDSDEESNNIIVSSSHRQVLGVENSDGAMLLSGTQVVVTDTLILPNSLIEKDSEFTMQAPSNYDIPTENVNEPEYIDELDFIKEAESFPIRVSPDAMESKKRSRPRSVDPVPDPESNNDMQDDFASSKARKRARHRPPSRTTRASQGGSKDANEGTSTIATTSKKRLSAILVKSPSPSTPGLENDRESLTSSPDPSEPSELLATDTIINGMELVALDPVPVKEITAAESSLQYGREFAPIYERACDLRYDLEDLVNNLPDFQRNSLYMREILKHTIFHNTREEEDAPVIGIYNDVDDEVIPPWEFHYSNRMWHGEGVPPPDIKNLRGCDCVGACNPRSRTCACIRRQQDYCKTLEVDGFLYDDNGRLKNEQQQWPIVECNDLCNCSDLCKNRVVQLGRKCEIEIRKTKKKGWGVFATNEIKKGTFVGIYSGELLADDEGERRGILYNKVGRTYLFDIDFWFINGEEEDENEPRGNLYTVDAFHAGNFTRFLNHSCEPNCVINACYINEAYIEKPLLTIFTCDNVAAGEELCFSYFGEADENDDEQQEEGNDDNKAAKRKGKGKAKKSTSLKSPKKKSTVTVNSSTAPTDGSQDLYRQCECGAKTCKKRNLFRKPIAELEDEEEDDDDDDNEDEYHPD